MTGLDDGEKPPMAFLVCGGTLAPESVERIRKYLDELRAPKFHTLTINDPKSEDDR